TSGTPRVTDVRPCKLPAPPSPSEHDPVPGPAIRRGPPPGLPHVYRQVNKISILTKAAMEGPGWVRTVLLRLLTVTAVAELVGERWMGRMPAELGPGPGRVGAL